MYICRILLIQLLGCHTEINACLGCDRCQVSFEENVPGRLRCVSVGGYPPPKISVFIGQRDATPLFTWSTSATLHGTRGLRLIVHETVLWTDQLSVTAADDGSIARCVATVYGLAANSTYVRITVNCKSLSLCSRHTQGRINHNRSGAPYHRKARGPFLPFLALIGVARIFSRVHFSSPKS